MSSAAPAAGVVARRIAPRGEVRARRLMWLSAVVATAGIVILLVDHGLALARAGEEKTTVDGLVERIKTDPAVAQTLLDERERQTAASVRRRDRSQVLAWVVLVAGALFVASGKAYMARRPQRLPGLDELVAIRFAPPPQPPARAPSDAGSPARGSPADTAGETAGTEAGAEMVSSGAATPAAVAENETIDLSFVDELVARVGTSREAAIPILQAIQERYRYLPDAALARVCEITEITPAQVAGTSSFYAQFRRSPVGRHVVRVCHGTACHVAGAELITAELRRHLDIAPGEDTDPGRQFTIDAVACLGCCSLAPVMMIEEETAGRLTPASARQALDTVEPSS